MANQQVGIKIPKDVYEKVIYWVKKKDAEVSGFGMVEYNSESKTFDVVDAFLLEQEVGSTHTDINPTSLAKLQYRAIKDKYKGTLSWWWHSHVKMDTFWSSTDKETIKLLGEKGFIVASVFNQHENVRSAACMKVSVPFIGDSCHFLDEIPMTISDYYPQEKLNAWDKEFVECVKEKKYQQQGMLGSNYESKYGRFVNSVWFPKTAEEQAEWEEKNKPVPAVAGIVRSSDRGPAASKNQQKRMLKIEAKALGMSLEAYKNLLDRGSYLELCEIEEKLFKLQNSGGLPRDYQIYTYP